MGKSSVNTVSVFTYPATHHMSDLGVHRDHVALPYLVFALLLRYQKKYTKLFTATYTTTQDQFLKAFPSSVDTLEELHGVFNTLHAK